MINALYDNARERMLKNQMDWANLSMLMLAYTGDPTTSFHPAHLVQSDLGTPYAVSQTLLTPTVMAGGYARTSAANFLVIPVGSNVQFFVLAENNATAANRKLIAFLGSMNNLPLVPNGGNYLVKPDWLAAQGWFRS